MRLCWTFAGFVDMGHPSRPTLALVLLSLLCTFAYTSARDLLQDTEEGSANVGAAPEFAPAAAQAPDSAPASSSLPAPLQAPAAVGGVHAPAQAPTQFPAVSTAPSGGSQETHVHLAEGSRVLVFTAMRSSARQSLVHYTDCKGSGRRV